MYQVYTQTVEAKESAYTGKGPSRPAEIATTPSGGTNPFGKTCRTLTLILVVAIYAAKGDQSSGAMGSSPEECILD